jgi:hypothetical protein
MTEQEKKEIIRVCGENFDHWDIPAYIRQRDKKRELAKANSPSNPLSQEGGSKSMAEESEAEDHRQRELERRDREKLESFNLADL